MNDIAKCGYLCRDHVSEFIACLARFTNDTCAVFQSTCEYSATVEHGERNYTHRIAVLREEGAVVCVLRIQRGGACDSDLRWC